MTLREFTDTMRVLEASTSKMFTEQQAFVWFELLSDLTVDQLRRGVIETIKTHQFSGWPPVGVIRKNAIGGVQVTTLEVDHRAQLAWSRVVEAIRDHGGYRTVQFDDPITHAAIRAAAGSWLALCNTESENLHWTRTAFIAHYKAVMAAGHVTSNDASPMAGILATDAGRFGYEVPEAIPVKSHLPAAPIKVIVDTKPVHIAAAETVGQEVRLPFVPKTPADVDSDPESAPRDTKALRAEAVEKLRKRFGHLVEKRP